MKLEVQKEVRTDRTKMSNQYGGQACDAVCNTASEGKRGPSKEMKAAWRRYTENGRLKRMNFTLDPEMDFDKIIRQVWSPTQSYSVWGEFLPGTKEKNILPKEGSLICPPGKLIIF